MLLIGTEATEAIARLNVLVVGVGGVGAYAAEMLIRAGVGQMTIVDGDCVNSTNLNRQLIALNSTLGEVKTNVLKHRLLDINPKAKIIAHERFLKQEDVPQLFESEKYDYVVDAIDTIAPKVAIIEYCIFNKIKIISSMGAGGRMNPAMVQYADIWATYHDGLAKAVRTKLKEKGIHSSLKVVWSAEQPSKSALMLTDESQNKRSSYGTISYMPCVFGCFLASYIINREKTIQQ